MDDVYKLEIGDCLISLTGETGRIAIVDEKNCLLNQRVGKIVCKSNFKSFVYCLLTSKFFQLIINQKSVGTSQKNVSPLDIENIDIYLPTEKELNNFNLVAEKLLKKKITLLRENKILAENIKYNLPLLMNGQIKLIN